MSTTMSTTGTTTGTTAKTSAVLRLLGLLLATLSLLGVGATSAHAAGAEWSPYLPKKTVTWGDCAIAAGFGKDLRSGSTPTNSYYGAQGAGNLNCNTVKSSITLRVTLYYSSQQHTGYYPVTSTVQSATYSSRGFGSSLTTTSYVCGRNGWWMTRVSASISGYNPVEVWGPAQQGPANFC
jgi:hypothetical protein